MSLAYRNRIVQLLAQNQDLGMTEEERKDIFGWCKISDDVIRDLLRDRRLRQEYRNIDDFAERCSDDDIKQVHEQVMKIYRMRKRKKAKAANTTTEAETEKVSRWRGRQMVLDIQQTEPDFIVVSVTT